VRPDDLFAHSLHLFTSHCCTFPYSPCLSSMVVPSDSKQLYFLCGVLVPSLFDLIFRNCCENATRISGCSGRNSHCILGLERDALKIYRICKVSILVVLENLSFHCSVFRGEAKIIIEQIVLLTEECKYGKRNKI